MQRLAPFLVAVCLAAPVSAAELTGTAEASGKPVQYAVVWLDVEQPPPVNQASKVVLDQRNLAFNPPVLVVRVGTAIDFRTTTGSSTTCSPSGTAEFDLGMCPTGTSNASSSIVPDSRLFCNIHPNMAAT
jgi:plastocyanin